MQTKEEIYNEWLAEDFILSEIDRKPNTEDKLVLLYDYLRLLEGFNSELEEEMC